MESISVKAEKKAFKGAANAIAGDFYFFLFLFWVLRLEVNHWVVLQQFTESSYNCLSSDERDQPVPEEDIQPSTTDQRDDGHADENHPGFALFHVFIFWKDAVLKQVF